MSQYDCTICPSSSGWSCSQGRSSSTFSLPNHGKWKLQFGHGLGRLGKNKILKSLQVYWMELLWVNEIWFFNVLLVLNFLPQNPQIFSIPSTWVSACCLIWALVFVTLQASCDLPIMDNKLIWKILESVKLYLNQLNFCNEWGDRWGRKTAVQFTLNRRLRSEMIIHKCSKISNSTIMRKDKIQSLKNV